jgi:hypothetical protein
MTSIQQYFYCIMAVRFIGGVNGIILLIIPETNMVVVNE